MEANGGWERYRGYIILSLTFLAVLGGVFFWQRRPEPAAIEVIPPPPTDTPAPTATPPPLRIYVCGAVRHPDVYRLPVGSIVKEAIEAAGGPTAKADLNHINLALQLADQQQVYVPEVGEDNPPVSPPSGPPAPAAAGQSGGKININTASVEALDALPGIGPAFAQRIVDYRQANGPFQRIEDITNVSGIGPATFEKIKDRITVK